MYAPKSILFGGVLLIAALSGFIWFSLQTPSYLTCEQLNAGWQQVAGKYIDVECTLERVYLWCCTVGGSEMIFINFVPFRYGERRSYTSFSGVAWNGSLYDCLWPFKGKRVIIRGQIGSYLGSGQITITDCGQVTLWTK